MGVKASCLELPESTVVNIRDLPAKLLLREVPGSPSHTSSLPPVAPLKGEQLHLPTWPAAGHGGKPFPSTLASEVHYSNPPSPTP